MSPQTSTTYLNGIRGLAALIVAFTHFIAGEVETGFRGYFAEPAAENRHFYQLPPFRIIFADQAMVALFFIVSAYSISIKPLRLRDYAGGADGQVDFLKSLVSAVLRRPIRLYLPVVVLEVISHILFYLGFYPWVDLYGENVETAGGVVAHFISYMLDAIYPLTPKMEIGLNIQVWTIPAEFRGSLVIFLLILCTAYLRPFARLAIVLVAALLAVWELDWILSTFISGLLISEIRLLFDDVRFADALYWSGRPFARALLNIGNGVLFVVGFYLLCIPERPSSNPWSAEYSWLLGHFDAAQWNHDTNVSHLWRSLGGILWIFSISNCEALQAPFNAKPVQYLGKISFGLYLVHVLIIRICRDRLIQLFWWFLGSDGAMGWIGAAIVLVPVTWLCAHIFWLAVDTKAIVIARWVETKLTKEKKDEEALMGQIYMSPPGAERPGGV